MNTESQLNNCYILSDELEHTYIRVSNDPEDDLSSNDLDDCGRISSNEEDDIIEKQCDVGLVGQYIGMRRRGRASNSDILELCEMVVIGYKYGGNWKTCSRCNNIHSNNLV